MSADLGAHRSSVRAEVAKKVYGRAEGEGICFRLLCYAASLQKKMSPARCPSHLLFLDEPLGEEWVDRRIHKPRRYSFLVGAEYITGNHKGPRGILFPI